MKLERAERTRRGLGRTHKPHTLRPQAGVLNPEPRSSEAAVLTTNPLNTKSTLLTARMRQTAGRCPHGAPF